MKIHRIVKSLRVARFNKNFNLVSRMRIRACTSSRKFNMYYQFRLSPYPRYRE